MSSKTLQRLLSLTFLAFAVFTLGHHFFPEWLRLLAIIEMILLIPVGIFFSLRQFFTSETNRAEFGSICLCFLFLFSFNIAADNMANVLLLRTTSLVYLTNPIFKEDPETLRTVVHLLYDNSEDIPTETRKKLAQTLYIMNGLILPYPQKDGSYSLYAPTEKEKSDWEQFKKKKDDGSKKIQDLERRLRAIPPITLAYAVSFFLTFLAGILHSMFHQRYLMKV